MAELATALPKRFRDSGQVDVTEALNVSREANAVSLSLDAQQVGWHDARPAQLLGVRVAADGQASAWASLPGDTMGAILDPSHLATQLSGMLRLLGALRVIDAQQVGLGVGVDPAMMLSTGRVDQLPRSSAILRSSVAPPIRVPPDELVSIAALDAGAQEVASSLARALVDALQQST